MFKLRDVLMPVLSVIVLSKNNGDTLETCLRSIVKSRVPEGWDREIVVVDAHSTDNTPYILKKYSKYIRVVYDEGRGIGIARNIGISNARGDVICFVDADCIVGRDHFVEIVKAMESYDIIDVASDYQRLLSMNIPKLFRYEIFLRMHGKAYSKKMREDRWFAAGDFISFKRKVWDQVKFWTYPEFGCDDVDFGFRARLKGFRIGVVDVRGTVSIHRSRLRDLIREQKGWGRGYAYLIAKYRNTPIVWRAYHFKPIIYRVLGRYAWLYVIFRFLLPLGVFGVALKARSLGILPYYFLRRWVYAYSLLRNLKKAFSYYSRKRI